MSLEEALEVLDNVDELTELVRAAIIAGPNTQAWEALSPHFINGSEELALCREAIIESGVWGGSTFETLVATIVKPTTDGFAARAQYTEQQKTGKDTKGGRKTASGKPRSRKTTAGKAAGGKATGKKAASGKATGKKAASGKAGSHKSRSRKPASRKTTSRKGTSRKA